MFSSSRRSLSLVLLATVALVAAACGTNTKASEMTYVPTVIPTAAPTVGPTAAPTVTPATTADVPVSLSEWKVTMPATLKPGVVNFAVTNDGTMEHEMLVFKSDLAPADYPKDANGDIVEDGAGVSLISDAENIAPKGTQPRTVDLSTPGTYLFVCNIPGHFKAGMSAVVTVTP